MWWEYLLNYLIVFAAGGLICVIAQVLIIKTKLTPARILVLFLIGGIVLQAVGVYDFLYKYLGSGISVPSVLLWQKARFTLRVPWGLPELLPADLYVLHTA